MKNFYKNTCYSWLIFLRQYYIMVIRIKRMKSYKIMEPSIF